MLKKSIRSLQKYWGNLQLPLSARKEARKDRKDGLSKDPGIDGAISAACQWLSVAQDRSVSSDGGVARHYSLVSGWGSSYPETTGYIVPTLLERAHSTGNDSLADRARNMLDWLISIQLPSGAFQGGVIDANPIAPVTFNTGQILLGLAAGVQTFGKKYLRPMHAAAQWLVKTQAADGAWRQHFSPFAATGEKAYFAHVAWGLLEAGKVASQDLYIDAALRNIDWALTKQTPNGWFRNNSLDDPDRPHTHTIGYVLRGIVEGYRCSGRRSYLDAATKCAEGVVSSLREDGFLPGRLTKDWEPASKWVCLTGSVQIAHCWLLLYRETSNPVFKQAGYGANRFVRRTMRTSGDPNVVGGVKGSFPVSGNYAPYEYLNWACKFTIDANVLEKKIREEEDDSTI